MEPHVRGHVEHNPVDYEFEHSVRVLPAELDFLPEERELPGDDGVVVRVESVLQLRVREGLALLVGGTAHLHRARGHLPRPRRSRAPAHLLRRRLREGLTDLRSRSSAGRRDLRVETARLYDSFRT